MSTQLNTPAKKPQAGPHRLFEASCQSKGDFPRADPARWRDRDPGSIVPGLLHAAGHPAAELHPRDHRAGRGLRPHHGRHGLVRRPRRRPDRAVVSASMLQIDSYASKFYPNLHHIWLPIPIIIGIVSGLIIGCVNGIIIAKLKVPPFIATLGTMVASTGLTPSTSTAIPTNRSPLRGCATISPASAPGTSISEAAIRFPISSSSPLRSG